MVGCGGRVGCVGMVVMGRGGAGADTVVVVVETG